MIDNEGWRAHVLYESPMIGINGGVRLIIGRRLPNQMREYVTGVDPAMGLVRQIVEEAAEPPMLNLPIEIARVLLDGLLKHFGGTSEGRQLRTDYDAERARVDKLTGALITVATGSAALGGKP